jgi:hypothetical protein
MTLRFPWLGLIYVVAVLSDICVVRAQSPKSSESLTVEEVVQLSKAGFSDDVIITKIRKNGRAFDLNPAELLELRNIGISDSVIKFLLDPSQSYTPQPPSPPGRPDTGGTVPSPARPLAKDYPPDRYAPKVPPEPGLYLIQGELPLRVDIKILLGTKEGAGLGKVLMKKGKLIGYLVGPVAKSRIKNAMPVFYMRLPEGKAIEEIVLVAFDRRADRREIEMGPAGSKQELKKESMRQFDSLEVGPSLFKLSPIKLAEGEYLFFQLGSAEPPKGSYGKGFDFAIETSDKQ